MSVFAPRRAAIISQVSRTLFNRVTSFFECSLTHTEVEEMVVRPEHLALLREANQIVNPDNKTMFHNVAVGIPMASVETPVRVHLNSKNGFSFLLPSYADTRPAFVPSPSETLSRIQKWLAHRIEVGIEWGRVEDVFDYLNNVCETPQQMRFYFPGLVTLMVNSGDDPTIKLGNKLRTARTPTNFISLNREQKEYIGLANTALATAQLFLNNTPPPTPACRVQAWSVDEVECPRTPFNTAARIY